MISGNLFFPQHNLIRRRLRIGLLLVGSHACSVGRGPGTTAKGTNWYRIL